MARHEMFWFAFHPKDWLTDTELMKCSLETQGIWIRLLCHMHHAPIYGEVTGLLPELARLVGCNLEAFKRALFDLETLNVADVSCDCPPDVHKLSIECPGTVRLVSRRMKRDEAAREKERKRKRQERVAKRRNASASCPPDVREVSATELKSESESDTNSESEKESDSLSRGSRERKKERLAEFADWWKGYPRKRGKQRAENRWLILRKTRSAEELTAARDRFLAAMQEESREIDFMPHGSTFLMSQIDDWLDGNQSEDTAGYKAAPDKRKYRRGGAALGVPNPFLEDTK